MLGAGMPEHRASETSSVVGCVLTGCFSAVQHSHTHTHPDKQVWVTLTAREQTRRHTHTHSGHTEEAEHTQG